MRYIFNANGKCVASCNYEPNLEDLATRNEIAIASDKIYDVSEIQLTNNVITKIVNIIPFETLQANKLNSAVTEFIKRRDATTYVTQLDGVTVYGYDRQTEDMVNFMAARERAKLAESVPYKVYLADSSKALVDHTLDMFDMCLNQSATEQLSAYAWYEDIKAQITACTTETELDAIIW